MLECLWFSVRTASRGDVFEHANMNLWWCQLENEQGAILRPLTKCRTKGKYKMQ